MTDNVVELILGIPGVTPASVQPANGGRYTLFAEYCPGDKTRYRFMVEVMNQKLYVHFGTQSDLRHWTADTMRFITSDLSGFRSSGRSVIAERRPDYCPLQVWYFQREPARIDGVTLNALANAWTVRAAMHIADTLLTGKAELLPIEQVQEYMERWI